MMTDTTQVKPPPTRDEIVTGQRNNLVVQLLDAEADKQVVLAALDAARQRIAELERMLAALKPEEPV